MGARQHSLLCLCLPYWRYSLPSLVLDVPLLLSSDTTLYNAAVNKRARKRLKEAIEKKNLERQKMLKEQSSASSQTKERRGFTVKPEKKRG
jgi:hypothetical protein